MEVLSVDLNKLQIAIRDKQGLHMFALREVPLHADLAEFRRQLEATLTQREAQMHFTLGPPGQDHVTFPAARPARNELINSQRKR